MADKKIKVNELPSATPTLNDTLLGSNATKEYACKIEDLASLVGGSSGVIMVTETYDSTHDVYVLDKTWNEIAAVANGGGIVVLKRIFDDEGLTSYSYLACVVDTTGGGDSYTVAFIELDMNDYGVGHVVYHADTANDYPSRSELG